MPITTYTAYKADVDAPYQTINSTKASLATVAGRVNSFWTVAPFGGAVPTTAAVPTNATLGSIAQLNSSGIQRLAQMELSHGNGGYLMVCDRLAHQGGLSAIVTGAQTTNLPTAALTRYTTGAGVFAAIEIYTIIGTTATTVTASYTDQDGTAGNTTIATALGGTGFREAARFIILPLAAGDTGVRSVENINIVATTGTAGNMGITLFKPLFVVPMPIAGGQQIQADSVLGLCGNMPEIANNACLFYVYIANTSASGIMQNKLTFIEE
jgi:hypothetical protein